MADNRVFSYITLTELYILLAAAGVDRWYGPGLENVETTRKFNRVMADMYHKEMIDWDGDAAMIRKDISTAIEAIKNAKGCILIGKQSGEQGLSYIYAYGERITELYISQRDENRVRMTEMSFDEWIRQLEEDNYYPELIIDEPEVTIADLESREADVCSVMELRDMLTGDIQAQIHVVDNGTYGVIYLTCEDAQDIHICSHDEYEQLLRNWTEGRPV